MGLNWTSYYINGSGTVWKIIRYTDNYLYIMINANPWVKRSNNDAQSWSNFYPGDLCSERRDCLIGGNGNLITVGKDSANHSDCHYYNGSSWNNALIDSATSRSLWIVKRSIDSVLYTGTDKLGAVIKKSTTHGASWISETTFSSGDLPHGYGSIIFNDYIYVGGDGNKCYRKELPSGGWGLYNTGLSHNLYRFGICQGVLFAGAVTGEIYKLVGSTWTLVTSTGLTRVNEFQTIGNDLYVVGEKASGDRIYKTENLGGSWIAQGITDRNLYSLYYDESTHLLFAGSIDYVYVTEDLVLPSPPTGISVEAGEGLNTITFTADPEADETHIYWLNSPGVSPGTGNKISDVTSPHVHDDLNPSLVYYYILTSENEEGEGDPSAEYNNSPIPEPPIGVTVTPGSKKNTIEWDEALGADKYNIYWSYSSGVNKITSTKIADVTSGYEHTDLEPGIPVYYAIASEDEDGESSLSEEKYGIPLLPIPDAPVVTGLQSDSENIITISEVEYATIYNIYWSLTPGVTKSNSTKISNVTSPYNHIDLIRQNYYYVTTSENELHESDISNEICLKPDFEGKIFDHTDQIKLSLLYQYQVKD